MLRLFRILCRLVPVIGLIANRLRFPGLKTGLGVVVEGGSALHYGSDVSFGQGTRVDNIVGNIVLGDDVSLARDVYLVSSAGCELKIAARTAIQDDCRIYGDVHIGRRCIFAPNAHISSGHHTFDAIPALPIQVQEQMVAAEHRPIKIGEDCWFGVNAVVVGGATIGRGCVIGANAVVTRDVAPYSVVAGIPAKVIRQRLSFAPKSKADASFDEDIPYFYEGFEYAVQPRTWLEAPDKNFTIVLKTENAAGVELCLSGMGEIRFGAQSARVPLEPGIVKFDFLGQVAPNFLTFSSDATCRIYKAKVF